MTPAQFDALRAYVDALTDHMVHHSNEPHTRRGRYIAALAKLEASFFGPLPLDLFGDVPAPTGLPDIL